eukprot:XP_019920689.1 PREDICTED: circumsporozoite protein-like [Crassostrea gigas]
MIPAVVLLCLVAGSIAMAVNTDYYPKSQEYGGRRINGGFIGINNNGFAAAAAAAAAGQQSAAAAAAAAAAGQNAAAAAAAAAGRNAAAAAAAAAGQNAAAAASASGANFGSHIGIRSSQFAGQIGGQFVQPSPYYPNVVGQNSGSAAAAAAAAASNNAAAAAAAAASANGFNGGIIGGSTGVIGSRFVPGKKY